MTTQLDWRPDDIDLSDMEFWKRPWSEREAAFATLRDVYKRQHSAVSAAVTQSLVDTQRTP